LLEHDLWGEKKGRGPRGERKDCRGGVSTTSQFDPNLLEQGKEGGGEQKEKLVKAIRKTKEAGKVNRVYCRT